jgi:ferric-dicitrate binding protein FerR (iron transport regulator)
MYLDRRSLLGGAAAALFLAPVDAVAQNAQPAGTVEEVQGEASATANGEPRKLDRSTEVFVEEMLATGRQSRLAVRLGRDTRLRLGEETRLKIDKYIVQAGGEISLVSGAMLFNRTNPAPEPMKIRSPFGLIAVRGTRFFVGPSANVFGVFVERGRLEVSAAGRSVTLRAGEGRPGAPPTRPKKWGPPRIKAALATVD